MKNPKNVMLLHWARVINPTDVTKKDIRLSFIVNYNPALFQLIIVMLTY